MNSRARSLLESGNAKDAVAPLRKAVSLTPNSSYMRIELAQAILESGGNADEALKTACEWPLWMRTSPISATGWNCRLMANSADSGPRTLPPRLRVSIKAMSKQAKMLAERAKNGLGARAARHGSRPTTSSPSRWKKIDG